MTDTIKKRGRPAKKKVDVVQKPLVSIEKDKPTSLENKPSTVSKRERLERVEDAQYNTRRKQRVPMGRQRRLGFPSNVQREENMHYSWPLMGEDDRGNKADLNRYIEAGYEFALNIYGEKEVRPAGYGLQHVLMKVEKRFYEEDFQLEQQRCIDSTNYFAQLQDGEYVPDGREGVLVGGMGDRRYMPKVPPSKG